jgi:hypothetical protein
MRRSVRSAVRCGVLALLGVAVVLTMGCPPRPRGLTGPNADSIEAATMIDYPTERLKVLHKIAERENLTPEEQLYLIDAICAPLGFGDDQSNALVALIRNPVLTEEAREHIWEMLPKTRMGSSKARVIEALEAHPRTDGSAERGGV